MSSQTCPDCGVDVGHFHEYRCNVELCPACGKQKFSCSCSEHEQARYPALKWDGTWPGDSACREFGFYARTVPGLLGWQRCAVDAPGARFDLNRLSGSGEARWDPEHARWVLQNMKDSTEKTS